MEQKTKGNGPGFWDMVALPALVVGVVIVGYLCKVGLDKYAALMVILFGIMLMIVYVGSALLEDRK